MLKYANIRRTEKELVHGSNITNMNTKQRELAKLTVATLPTNMKQRKLVRTSTVKNLRCIVASSLADCFTDANALCAANLQLGAVKTDEIRYTPTTDWRQKSQRGSRTRRAVILASTSRRNDRCVDTYCAPLMPTTHTYTNWDLSEISWVMTSLSRLVRAPCCHRLTTVTPSTHAFQLWPSRLFSEFSIQHLAVSYTNWSHLTSNHVTSDLKVRHWLPIKEHVDHELFVLVLVHNVSAGRALLNMSDMLTFVLTWLVTTFNWLIGVLTARQHRKVNLCQLWGKETGSVG